MFTAGSLTGKAVTVMGLGRFGGGVGAVKFLCRQGARVTVTDSSTPEELAVSLAEIADCDIERFCLGGHPEIAFVEADLVVVNPAVCPDHPCLKWCRRKGVPLTTEIALFCQFNPARTIGVTGSNGKSTTATLIHTLLDAAGMRAFLGGNIGGSLLDSLDDIAADDWVILELSSFQLAYLDALFFSPQIAVVTNFSPNHLDWHGSLEEYRRAKQAILRWQCPHGIAVLNADDPASQNWPVNGRSLRIGIEESAADGVCRNCDGTGFVVRTGSAAIAVEYPFAQQFPGRHQQENALAAVAASLSAGVPVEALTAGLSRFRPLPHRLEFLGEFRGRRFYNDSKATTPEAAQAALRAFEQPVVLLAGGADKHVDLRGLAASITERVKAVVLMGETAPVLEAFIREQAIQQTPAIQIAESFPAAFDWAVSRSEPGDVVLLSPGCASFGWFRDFEDRGRKFAAAVERWGKSSA